jgi:poly-D-alanine transfer protein DltD
MTKIDENLTARRQRNAAAIKAKDAAKRKPRAKKVETLTETEATALLDRAGENAALADIVKDVKKRKPSSAERGEDGKVVRTGRNLSGNQPFKAKLYYYDLSVKSTPDYDKAFQAAPNQVRLLLNYMADEGITTADDAMRGGEICGSAINSGKLASKIDPAALFAYYRRVMETLGLRLAA